MRTLHLYCNRDSDTESFVAGIRSTSPVTEVRIIQDDAVRIVVHSLRQNSAVPAINPFIEEPLDFTGIRVSLGQIDAAPATGTFRFKVGNNLSAQLTWPADLTTDVQKQQWKTAMLNALIATTGVGADAVKIDDPAATPGHFVYFTWTDPARTTEIEVVQNRLLPLTSAKARLAATPGGYTQLIKFVRQPVAIANTFARPLPPPVTRIETRAGASGVNAEQTLIVPPGAAGGVSLGWSGAATSVMGVDNLTAAQIATNLNAIVPAGSTNASFAVTERPSQSGRRFAVEFIGPLASAVQPLLTVTMTDQIGLPFATGKLDLSQSGLAIEQVLNGSSEVPLKLELVITTADGEETYLATADLVNDMTAASTIGEVEAGGAVLVRETVVYVEADPQPYFEVAPGLSYTPALSADIYNITHNLATWHPSVRLSQKIGTSPELWRVLPDNEYAAESTSANVVRLTMPVTLSTDTASPDYFGNFKAFISSPEATVRVFEHEHTWDDIRTSLPDGQTLRAKLAALDAALGIVAGQLVISAANITGVVKASQIDLADLSTTLRTTTQFLSTLRTLATDSVLVDVLGERLRLSQTFAETLTELIATEEIRTDLVTALGADPGFLALSKKIAVDVLQSGVFPDGSILIELADIDRSLAPLVSGKVVTASLGNVTGSVPRADSTNNGKSYAVVGKARATARIGTLLERTAFVDGQTIVSNGARWYAATLDGTFAYPKALETELFRLHVNASMLVPRTRFAVAFTVSLHVESPGVSGQCVLEVRLGVPGVDAGPANISGITWGETPVIQQTLNLTDSRIFHTFRYAVTCDPLGTLSATKKIYTSESAAAAPASPAFFLQARIVRVDLENLPLTPAGTFHIGMKEAKASIIPI